MKNEINEILVLYKNRKLVDKIESFLLLCEISGFTIECDDKDIIVGLNKGYYFLIRNDGRYFFENYSFLNYNLDFVVSHDKVNENELFDMILNFNEDKMKEYIKRHHF